MSDEDQNSIIHPYERLSPNLIMDAIESLDFTVDGRYLELNSYENRVLQIGLDQNPPLIAKFYRPNRWSREAILEEHEFSLALQEDELPVVAPMVIKGQTLHEHEGFYFAVFPRQGGHAPELNNLENLKILGRTISRIHQVGRTINLDHRPTLSIEQWGKQSIETITNSPWLPDYLSESYQTLTQDLIVHMERIWQSYTFNSQPLHGDCHPGNILWRDDNPHFVDLDDCIKGPAVQDLWMLIAGDWQENRYLLDALLEGYETFNQFDLQQLNLIETLRTLRLMNYSAWLARRWDDPAFPRSFPWFGEERYWSNHILELREQLAKLQESSFF